MGGVYLHVIMNNELCVLMLARINYEHRVSPHEKQQVQAKVPGSEDEAE